jgi:hypothetical protein
MCIKQYYVEKNMFRFGVCSCRNESPCNNSATKTQVDKNGTVGPGKNNTNERLDQAEAVLV